MFSLKKTAISLGLASALVCGAISRAEAKPDSKFKGLTVQGVGDALGMEVDRDNAGDWVIITPYTFCTVGLLSGDKPAEYLDDNVSAVSFYPEKRCETEFPTVISKLLDLPLDRTAELIRNCDEAMKQREGYRDYKKSRDCGSINGYSLQGRNGEVLIK